MSVAIGTLIGVEFGASRDRAISKASVTTIVAFICIVREVPLMVRSAANWARGEVAMGWRGTTDDHGWDLYDGWINDLLPFPLPACRGRHPRRRSRGDQPPL